MFLAKLSRLLPAEHLRPDRVRYLHRGGGGVRTRLLAVRGRETVGLPTTSKARRYDEGPATLKLPAAHVTRPACQRPRTASGKRAAENHLHLTYRITASTSCPQQAARCCVRLGSCGAESWRSDPRTGYILGQLLQGGLLGCAHRGRWNRPAGESVMEDQPTGENGGTGLKPARPTKATLLLLLLSFSDFSASSIWYIGT